MSSDALNLDWSINMPKALPSPRRQAPETTPSKRRAPSLVEQVASDARTQSDSSLPRVDRSAKDSLGIPDLPTPRKRAKSTSGQSQRAVNANNNEAPVSPGPKTPVSCRKQAKDYKSKSWQAKHVKNCTDPTCQVKSASLQGESPSLSDDSSSRPSQQQVEDVFLSTPTKKQGASLGTEPCANVPPEPESSRLGARDELDGKKFETIKQCHSETPGSRKKDNLEPDDLDDAPSDEDESVLGDAGSTDDKSPLQIHSHLRAKFEQGVTSKDRPGYIYVMRDATRPHLCKIGRSTNAELRRKTIERKCGLKLKNLHYRPVDLYVKTEALLKAYLSDLCKPYTCQLCEQKHGEWFEISGELASVAVDKWVDFMQQKRPYEHRSRDLWPCWSSWLSVHEFTFVDADFDGLRSQWDKFMSRSGLDRWIFEITSTWEIALEFFWPVYATFAWTVTFIAFRHPLVFFMMAMSVIGTFVSMSQDSHLHRRAAATLKRRKAK